MEKAVLIKGSSKFKYRLKSGDDKLFNQSNFKTKGTKKPK